MFQVLGIRTTEHKQVLDITEDVRKIVGSGSGICHLFLRHTTAAVTTADLDPGTDLDMLDAFEAIMPKLKYRHPHDPSHVTDHILSSLIGTSIYAPFKKGELLLGTWQRIVLCEFDGPRDREIIAVVQEV